MSNYQDILNLKEVPLASISHYAMHFEALSRGLTVSILNKNNSEYEKYFLERDKVGRVYKISNNDKIYLFNTSRLINNGKKPNLSKIILSELLKNNGFNFIDSMVFIHKSKIDFSLIEKKINKPWVVKPTNGSMGNNVFCDLDSEIDLKNSISKQTGDFIIEHYISNADEYRVYVVNCKVIGFCKRIDPFVIGDGVNTLKQLVDLKNKIRSEKKLSKIIISPKVDIEKIPKLNEKVIVNNVKGRSLGADIEVIKGGLDIKIVNEIERFSKLFHENFVLGFDILVKKNELFILEINTRPQLSSGLFPDYGPQLDIPSEILNNLFGTSERKKINFEEFVNSYRFIKKNIGINWKQIDYSYKNGELIKCIQV